MCINSILLGMLGGQEILLIGIIALVLFGGKKIPELMRGLGKGVAEFKKAKNEAESEINDIRTQPSESDTKQATATPAPTESTKQ